MKQEPEEKREPRFYGEVTERSHKNMSRIRGKDTSIEVALLKENDTALKGVRFENEYGID
jgi:DNA mismatch endonuclease, patch repair protein